MATHWENFMRWRGYTSDVAKCPSFTVTVPFHQGRFLHHYMVLHCWDNFCVQWILVWWAAVVGRA